LANGKAPPEIPIFENLIRYVEDLNDARTTLADFFSILLKRGAEYADIQTIPSIDLSTTFQGSPFFSITC